MTVSAGKIWQAGARRLQFAHRNSSGYPVGTQSDPETITANTVMHAYVVQGLREFIPAKRKVLLARNKGDTTILGQMYMGVDDYGEGSFELSLEDETFLAALNRSVLDTSLASGMIIRAGNDSQSEANGAFLMATTRIQDITDGSYWYKTWIYNNSQVTADEAAPINQKDGDTPSPLKFKYAPSLSTRIITGHLLSDTDLTVLEDHDTYIVVRSRYPLAQTTYKANGVATTFKLAYLPVYSDATGAATNIIAKNGTTSTVTSVNVTTGIVTLAAAGTTGDLWTVLYQTNFTPSP